MIKIQEEKIDHETLVNEVKNDRAGAIVTFYGTVRSIDETSDDIIALIYEAYEEMAIKKIEEIIKDIALIITSFPLYGCIRIFGLYTDEHRPPRWFTRPRLNRNI